MSTTLVNPTKRGHNPNKLNVMQTLFVEALLADKTFNSTSAAEKAGYAAPSVAGCKLMRSPQVRAALGKAIQERMDKFEITQDRVLYELVCIGLVNMQDLFDSNGALIDLHKLPDRVARSVSSVKITYSDRPGEEEGTFTQLKHVELKFWDKVAALNLLGKHIGMFNDKLKVEHGTSPELDNLIGALLSKVEENASQVIDTSFIEHKEG